MFLTGKGSLYRNRCFVNCVMVFSSIVVHGTVLAKVLLKVKKYE